MQQSFQETNKPPFFLILYKCSDGDWIPSIFEPASSQESKVWPRSLPRIADIAEAPRQNYILMDDDIAKIDAIVARNIEVLDDWGVSLVAFNVSESELNSGIRQIEIGIAYSEEYARFLYALDSRNGELVPLAYGFLTKSLIIQSAIFASIMISFCCALVLFVSLIRNYAKRNGVEKRLPPTLLIAAVVAWIFALRYLEQLPFQALCWFLIGVVLAACSLILHNNNSVYIIK